MASNGDLAILKNHLLLTVCIFFLLLLLIVRGEQLVSSFTLNLANAVIYRSFSQEQIEAVPRQRAMAIAATLLGAGLQGLSNDPKKAEEMPMIPASLHGLYYHRLGDWNNAANWYVIAAQGEPIPEQQQQILISPWMYLAPTGDFVLDALTEEWHIRADTVPGAKIYSTDRGTLEFTCSEISEDSKIAILEWNQAFDIPYHHTLVLKAKTEIGTTLNLETVIDGQSIRPLTYNGTGKWEEFTIPVTGNRVTYIYVVIREDRNSNVKSCMTEIDEISFLID